MKPKRLGDGNINWPAVIAAAEASGCKWFIFEQDPDWYDNDPFIAAQRSFDYITHTLTLKKRAPHMSADGMNYALVALVGEPVCNKGDFRFSATA